MAYDHEARSRAAKDGWVWRRALANWTPTPEDLARRWLAQLVATIDDRAARLYACDLAEAVLPVVAEPERRAAAEAIAAGRVLAKGGMSEYARGKAVQAAIKMCACGTYHSPEISGRQTAGRCTAYQAAEAPRWAVSSPWTPCRVRPSWTRSWGTCSA